MKNNSEFFMVVRHSEKGFMAGIRKGFYRRILSAE